MKSMKKLVAALLVMTMVLALASTAFAYKDKEADKYVLFKKSAWGYEKVTNNYGKRKSSVALRKGSIAHVVAVKGDWYKIEIPARKAGAAPDLLYFKKKYTKDIAASNALLLFSSGGSGRSSEDPSFERTVPKGIKLRVIKGCRTNVRKTASLKGKSLGVIGKGHGYSVKLHKDRAYRFDSRGVLFVHIMYKGKPAWVSFEYLEFKK